MLYKATSPFHQQGYKFPPVPLVTAQELTGGSENSHPWAEASRSQASSGCHEHSTEICHLPSHLLPVITPALLPGHLLSSARNPAADLALPLICLHSREHFLSALLERCKLQAIEVVT